MLSQKQSSLPYFNRAFSGCLVVQLSPFHLWFLRSWLIGLITIHGSVVPPILFTTFVTSGRITAVKSVLDRLSAFTSLGKSELGQFIKNISIIHPIFCKNNLFQKKKLKAPFRKVSRNPPSFFLGTIWGCLWDLRSWPGAWRQPWSQVLQKVRHCLIPSSPKNNGYK